MIDKKAPGKSRISGARAHRLLRQWVVALNYIYNSAPLFMPSHAKLTEMVSTRIFITPEWSRVPSHVQAYILGMLEARRNEIHRHHLVWALSLDGMVLSRSQVDAMTEKERDELYRKYALKKTAPESDYLSPWSRINGEESCYVWKDVDGTPRPDKPF